MAMDKGIWKGYLLNKSFSTKLFYTLCKTFASLTLIKLFRDPYSKDHLNNELF